MKTMTVEEFRSAIDAQGMPAGRHVAVRCVMCGTVQSMLSFVNAGCTPEQAEAYIGFSCIGRMTDAGAWDARSAKRRAVPGCDWTLGGLFTIHQLEVVDAEGVHHPRFELATPAQARELMEREGRPVPAPHTPEPEKLPKKPGTRRARPVEAT